MKIQRQRSGMLGQWNPSLVSFDFLSFLDHKTSVEFKVCGQSKFNPITHGIFDPAVPRGEGVDSTPTPMENTLGGV